MQEKQSRDEKLSGKFEAAVTATFPLSLRPTLIIDGKALPPVITFSERKF